jgi:hypothetical protein
MKQGVNGKELHNLNDSNRAVIQKRPKYQRNLFVTIHHAVIIG